jgi:hypothetical protein
MLSMLTLRTISFAPNGDQSSKILLLKPQMVDTTGISTSIPSIITSLRLILLTSPTGQVILVSTLEEHSLLSQSIPGMCT